MVEDIDIFNTPKMPESIMCPVFTQPYYKDIEHNECDGLCAMLVMEGWSLAVTPPTLSIAIWRWTSSQNINIEIHI